MKLLTKICNIKNYIAAYRLKKENQIRKELTVNKMESEAFDYLRNHEFNKDNRALLMLRGNYE